MALEKLDFDADGAEEIIVKNPALTAGVRPEQGGAVFMLDYRPAAFCLTNTFTRHKEAYHQKLLQASMGQGQGGQPASIHDIVRVKEEGLANHLIYDQHTRWLYQERLLRKQTGMEAYRKGEYTQLGDFIDKPWHLAEAKESGGVVTIRLERKGIFHADGQAQPLLIAKTFRINGSDPAIKTSYQILNASLAPVSFLLAVEFNMTMLAADADDRYWTGGAASGKVRLKQTLADEAVSWVGMRDDWAGFSVRVESALPFAAWRYPVETVSQSESGFERTYQGSCLVAVREVDLAPGAEDEFNLDLIMKAER